MLSWPARLIDQVLLRLTVRQAQLRRRTLWPDAEALRRLRAGDPPAVSLADPGPPESVTFLDADGRGPFEFASSPPYGCRTTGTCRGNSSRRPSRRGRPW